VHRRSLLLFQERRREYSLKSPGIKPQAPISTRHNLVSSQQTVPNVYNGSFGSGSSTSSLLGSASTLSSRRHAPSSLSSATNSQFLNAADDDMDVDSLSSGTSTPMTTPTTTDSEFNMEEDCFNSTVSSSTSGFASS